MISSLISRASASFLGAGGLALLFAPDVVLPRLIPGFPLAGVWIGQLLAASWLEMAALNWLNRSALLGGIYARPVVVANALFYFVSAMVMLRKVTTQSAPAAVWVIVAPVVLFAALYGWLLLRGPIASDFESHRRAQGA